MSQMLPLTTVLSTPSARPEPRAIQPDRRPGALFTGTAEGVISTLIVISAAVVFGGGAGNWFAPGAMGWLGQALAMAAGTTLMGAAVALAGSLLLGRDAIFWGVTMPLLAYGGGAVCAFTAGAPGAIAFLIGAPLLCGLAITGGLLAAFLVDGRGGRPRG